MRSSAKRNSGVVLLIVLSLLVLFTVLALTFIGVILHKNNNYSIRGNRTCSTFGVAHPLGGGQSMLTEGALGAKNARDGAA